MYYTLYTFQIPIIPFGNPDAKYFPFGENDRQFTWCECLVSEIKGHIE